MSKSLKLSADLSLPLNVVTEKLAFLGRTGSGKTYAAMKLAELMLDAGAQVGVLDPVGVWRALRVPAEKGGKAFEVVVFGGLYGDLPLEAGAGALIADVVCDRGLSFVLDVSQFIPSEQQRFVQAFGARFFHRKKAEPTPSAVHLFLEECQEFIPENPSGSEAATLGVMQRLWKLGRNYGIGGSLISQRPQEIAKKALNMSGTLFAFQMTGPQERAAVRKWVSDQGIAADIEGVLQTLKRGQPHVEMHLETPDGKVYAHSGVVHILPRVTADLSSGASVGHSTVAKRPLTLIDVEQLKSAMVETIERAKADDPKELRRKIAEQASHLAQKDKRITELERSESRAAVPKGDTKEVEILTDADRARLAEIASALRERRANLEALHPLVLEKATKLIDPIIRSIVGGLETHLFDDAKYTAGLLEKAGFQRILDKLERVQFTRSVNPGRPVSTHPAARSTTPRPSPAAPSRPAIPARTPATGSGDAMLGKCERAILTVLANQPDGCDVDRVTLLTGYRYSGGFRNSLGALRTAGYIVGENTGHLSITDAGLTAVGKIEPLPSGAALGAYWLSHRSFGKCERAILGDLLAHREGRTAEQICAATNYEFSGGFRNALGALRTAGVIVGKNTEVMRASEELFD